MLQVNDNPTDPLEGSRNKDYWTSTEPARITPFEYLEQGHLTLLNSLQRYEGTEYFRICSRFLCLTIIISMNV